MSSYIHANFTNHIKVPIKTILECGSRDCLDAISMLEFYNADIIYSFECNPESIDICKDNIKNYTQIKLIEKAISNIDGQIDFYATDMELSKDKNIGASSVLLHRDNKESFFQKKIKVSSTRLDTFIKEMNIKEIDLLCMDLQGYEKIALEGLSDQIENIKYIILEVSFKSFYHNDVLFDEIYQFLSNRNFKFVNFLNEYDSFTDALFKNNNLKC